MTKETTTITVNSARCFDEIFFTVDVSIATQGETEGLQIKFERIGDNVPLFIDEISGNNGPDEALALFHANEAALMELMLATSSEFKVAQAS